MKFGTPHWRRGVRSMYRAILVTHRRVLNDSQRALGDRVVKEEFRKHMAVDEAKAQAFLSSWIPYLEALHKGRIPALDTSLFSDNQLRQLGELRKRIVHGDKVTETAPPS
eukprot:PhM_4_TR10284/c0_g2_i1/m.57118